MGGAARPGPQPGGEGALLLPAVGRAELDPGVPAACVCAGLPAGRAAQGDPEGPAPDPVGKAPQRRGCAEPGGKGLRPSWGLTWWSCRLGQGCRGEMLTRFSASSSEDLSVVFSCFCRDKGAVSLRRPSRGLLGQLHHGRGVPHRCWWDSGPGQELGSQSPRDNSHGRATGCVLAGPALPACHHPASSLRGRQGV